jgi:hypothetical protein
VCVTFYCSTYINICTLLYAYIYLLPTYLLPHIYRYVFTEANRSQVDYTNHTGNCMNVRYHSQVPDLSGSQVPFFHVSMFPGSRVPNFQFLNFYPVFSPVFPSPTTPTVHIPIYPYTHRLHSPSSTVSAPAPVSVLSCSPCCRCPPAGPPQVPSTTSQKAQISHVSVGV